MVDAAWLAQAMEAAGYGSNKALAEEAGVSSQTVSRVLKTGTCTQFTAEKLQRACGEHRIGPHMQVEDGPTTAELPPGCAFPGERAWFLERVGGVLMALGTRLDGDGLVEWGAVLYADEEIVGEAWGMSSHWMAREEGKLLVEEAA